ncbi:MAG: serpin family protein, partial [Lachnospiraceae bacterium]|nr:serpin family protein [Lachnospiraceae bacterium]
MEKRKCISRKALALTSVAVCVLILAIIIPSIIRKKNTGVVHAKDLMDGVAATTKVIADGQPADDLFKQKYTEFALALFRETLNENSEEAGVMVSPLSIYHAFAMAGNGATGTTRAEIEKALGIEIEELNKYLLRYMYRLKSTERARLSIANSIWLKNDNKLKVEEDFLQTNADYYGAEIYKADFDNKTVKDINGWVNKNTDGMIDKIIEKIDEYELMYLINAVAFEGEWDYPYNKENVEDGEFVNAQGESENVQYMYRCLDSYIKDDNALGFIRRYRGQYAFVALLPNEGLTVEEYLETLTAEDWLKLVDTEYPAANVHTKLPKFKSENTFDIKAVLENMGVTEIFSSGA